MIIKRKIYKDIKIIVFLLIILFTLTVAVSAEDYKVIFNHLDGIGDDYGPGSYQYPQNHIFQNKKGLFDLKALTIFENEKNYKFRFSFVKLTDPWGSEYGFSLPLVEIYLDNQAGGSNELFEKGANISFKEDFSWNYFIKFSGFWLKTFTPESKKENLLNINKLKVTELETPNNLKLYKEANQLYLIIPKSEIKLKKNSKLLLLIGSFDPFGYGHFRSLSQNKSYWQLYAGNDISKLHSPRVLDILTPAAVSQKEILKNKLAELPYLTVNEEIEERQPTIVDRFMPFNKISTTVLLVYIVLIIFIIYRFKYKK